MWIINFSIGRRNTNRLKFQLGSCTGIFPSYRLSFSRVLYRKDNVSWVLFKNSNFSGKLFEVLSTGTLESKQFFFNFEFWIWLIDLDYPKNNVEFQCSKGKERSPISSRYLFLLNWFLGYPSILNFASLFDRKLTIYFDAIDQNLWAIIVGYITE